MAVPLAPGLAQACSRRTSFRVGNSHDEPLSISSVSVDGGGFSIRFDRCSGQSVSWQLGSEECWFMVCFGSAASGLHAGEVRLATSVGVLTAPVAATVTAPWTGLDPTFQDGGVFAFTPGLPGGAYERPWAATTLGEGLVVSLGFVLHLFEPDGGYRSRDGTLPVVDGGNAGDNYGRYLDLAGAADRLYATVNTTSNYGKLVALRPDLTLDTAFASSGIIDVTFSVFQGRVVATNAAGTVYVAGSTGILALSPSGSPLSSFGQQGIVTISPGPKEMVCDGAGRLVTLSRADPPEGATATRYDGTSGAADVTSANLWASNVAIGAQDEVLVDQGGVSVVTGAGVSVLSAAVPGNDLAVDGAGRILVGGDGGVRRLSASGTFDRAWSLPGVLFVRCPPSGGCYVLGDTGEESYAARLEQ
jgi:hypothetical protein